MEWIVFATELKLKQISHELKEALVDAGFLKTDKFGRPTEFIVLDYEEIEEILRELNKYLVAVVEEDPCFFNLRECQTEEDFELLHDFLREIRILYPKTLYPP